jgi:hypothetical protein
MKHEAAKLYGLMGKRKWMILAALLLAALGMQAQQVVSGVVKDRQTGDVLSRVSITVDGSEAHTVTNDDGRFTLKVKNAPTYIQLSHIGYKTRRQQLNGQTEGLQIMMTSHAITLDEVVVSVNDPLEIVRAAMKRISSNYPMQPELMRCFYREVTRRGSRHIAVAEAVMDMYKSSYRYGPDGDAVGILKGRRLMSMKSKDTLGVKIQGGPMMPLLADVAKNPEYLLNEQDLAQCDLYQKQPAKLNDRLHYVIQVVPHDITYYPLMGGLLYIDQESLTITRAELELDVRDWRSASEYMLVKKPLGLRFRPKLLTMTVGYSTDMQGVTRMNYLRNEMRFNCDWKRRLFASTFTTVCEMVVTDRLAVGRDAKRPSGRSSFGIRDRFYDRVEYFDDPDFWADYNIIEPTESLEHAIDRLRKKLRN